MTSLMADDFFYFFLRLRKPRIRAVVEGLRARFPGESREGLARRLIDSHANLSLLGGTIFHAPGVLPGFGQAWRLFGLVGGASALTRMHLYLILEIALLYGKDIDDDARVPEMMAVVAATGAAVTGPALLLETFGVPALLTLPAAGLAATALTRLVGELAMEHYGKEAPAPLEEPAAG
ncbi:MAG: hypothetical protein HY900_08315 [Deltaproteobacteria bacterium]|nr:hypothetical protein [Deltaproteobacteria bacterium]